MVCPAGDDILLVASGWWWTELGAIRTGVGGPVDPLFHACPVHASTGARRRMRHELYGRWLDRHSDGVTGQAASESDVVILIIPYTYACK
jgi:hypothetical protein